jgi:filamentous hemagglutinin
VFAQPDAWAGKLENPQTLNPYAYALGNPLKYTDPTGNVPGRPVSLADLRNQEQRDANQQRAEAVQQAMDELVQGVNEAVDTTIAIASFVPGVDGIADAAATVKALAEGKFSEAATNAVLMIIPGASSGMAKVVAKHGDEAADASHLATRAKEIHSALPADTQRRTTTAVGSVMNPDGSVQLLVGSSEKSLRPAQRAVLKSYETAVSGLGHAEVKIINAAKQLGQKIMEIAASRPICDACAKAIKEAGAQPASKLKKKESM